MMQSVAHQQRHCLLPHLFPRRPEAPACRYRPALCKGDKFSPCLGPVIPSDSGAIPATRWATSPGHHSVSVDPISKEIFVPFAANAANTVCPAGCIAVFADVATAVPEPSTWAMMLIGFLGLGFAFRQSRRKVSFA